MEIKNSVAVITGGASGLGEATARSIVKAGGKVALLDLDQERGPKLAEELGETALFFPADVTQEEGMDRVVEKIKAAFGTFQAVVNCAGIGGSVKVVGKEGVMPLERFTRTVQINLTGTFNVIRATASTLMANNPNEEGERGVVYQYGLYRRL